MLDTVQPRLTANVAQVLVRAKNKPKTIKERPSIDIINDDDLLVLIMLRDKKATRTRAVTRIIYQWFLLNGQDTTPSRSLLLWAWKKGLWRSMKFQDGREQPASPMTIRILHKSELRFNNKALEIEACICRVADSLYRIHNKEQNQ